jgi:hypothetical protein
MNLLRLACTILLVTACSGGGEGETNPPPTSPPPTKYATSEPLIDNSSQRSLEVLVFGNSHAAGFEPYLEEMLMLGQPDKSINVALAPGWRFLVDRVDDGITAETLEGNEWTHVVLQAQKYSTTQVTTYPTTAAEYWIRGAKIQGATPILFPEHPRRSAGWESSFLLDLHQDIAAREPACVAPTGPVWDEVLRRSSGLTLHSPDGNHASATGNFVNAAILYQIISGEPATSIPPLSTRPISDDIQRLIRETVATIVPTFSPCPN